MAKFRQNHQRGDKSGFGGLFKRVLMFFGLAIFGFVYIYNTLSGNDSVGSDRQEIQYQGDQSFTPESNFNDFQPEGSSGQIINHDYYSLSYNEAFEVPEWVAYKLTAESLRAPRVPRKKRFTEDYEVKSKSARHKDYSHSGYTRGHMVPAGDMAFTEKAMKQTFFMSNMTPQIKAFNGGIWRELEESVRDWAFDNDELYVISGPIFNGKPKDYIGSNRVAVPDAFFKAILDNEGKEKKAIGFIMPHKKSTMTIDKYAVSIDEVERKTGFDFFGNLLKENEEEIEANFNSKKWRLNKKRHKQRVNNWNNN